MAALCARLFVYGTLRRTARHQMSERIARRGRFLGRAKTRGFLYDLGEYPGVVQTDEDAWVVGELYGLDDPNEALAELDIYEGCGPNDEEPHEYIRKLVTVVQEEGDQIKAWVYYYRGPLNTARRIVCGDYVRGSD